MARKVVVHLVDDLDGTEIAEGQGHTVQFSFDGVDYEIDLTEHNAEKLRNALAPFIQRARTASSSRKRSRATGVSDGPSASEIRAWARESGVEVPDRGRIPPSVREAYVVARG